MNNLILNHSDKISFIRQVLTSCRDLDITPFYSTEDDVFAGQFHVGGSIVSILLLTNKNKQRIYENERRIQDAVRNCICSGHYIIVLADEQASDLLDWYRVSVSFYTVYEHAYKLTDQLTCKDCLTLFKQKRNQWKGMFLIDNICIIQYTQQLCADCGQTFCFPLKLYMSTSDKYDSSLCYARPPFSDKQMQSIEQIRQHPSASIELYNFDDNLFMQFRAHLRRGINPDYLNNPYNRIAQPVITEKFQTEVPLVCPHCMSKVGVIHRDSKKITRLSHLPDGETNGMMEICKLNLEPDFIRTVLGPMIFQQA